MLKLKWWNFHEITNGKHISKMDTNFQLSISGIIWVNHTITSGQLVSVHFYQTEFTIHIFQNVKGMSGMKMDIGMIWILWKCPHKLTFQMLHLYCKSTKSPSEPVFCPHPDPLHESDGALMSLVSPLKDQDLKPFVVVLNGHTLEEISRFYLPDFVHVPVGFHSNWLPRESRYKKKHSYYPHL